MPEDFLASPPLSLADLPFKPTAIGRRNKPRPKPDDSDDDGLYLFRRSKRMAPIIAADNQRHWDRKQRQREQREKRRLEAAAGEKRALEEAQQLDGEAHSDNVEAQGVNSGTLEGQDFPTTQKDDDRARFVSSSDPFVCCTDALCRELATPPPSKRSRTDNESSRKSRESIEEADEIGVAEPSPSVRRFIHSYRAPESPPRPSSSRRSPVRRSPRKHAQQEVPRKQSFNPAQAVVISLDTDSDDDPKPATTAPDGNRSSSYDVTITRVEPVQPPAPEPVLGPDTEDDEFAEYVQKAREQREKNEALLRSTSNGSIGKESTTIIVRSEIPGTKTLGVKALYNQPLRLFRDSWLAIQLRDEVEIKTEHPEDMVITWRRRRVYNNSTLQMLGIRPTGDGRFAVDGRPFGSSSLRRSGFDESHTRVCLEIWTPELFAEMEREEDLRRRRDVGDLGYDEDEHGRVAKEEEPAAAAPAQKIKVVLKARYQDDVGLSVRAETTVETLITGYRTKRRLSAAKDVTLWFDGERLEEHMTMDDCEIVDMDTIEVHIK